MVKILKNLCILFVVAMMCVGIGIRFMPLSGDFALAIQLASIFGIAIAVVVGNSLMMQDEPLEEHQAPEERK